MVRHLLDGQGSLTATVGRGPHAKEEPGGRGSKRGSDDALCAPTHSPRTGLRGFFSDPIFSLRVCHRHEGH